MEEIKLEPQEIKLINPRRTSLTPVAELKQDPAPIRRKRNFAQNVILFLACVGAGFFAGVAIVAAVLFYCLQAGPI